MGEKSLPARKGREVRGLDSIKLRAVASTRTRGYQRWWVRAPLPPTCRSEYSPHPSGDGRDGRRCPPRFGRWERWSGRAFRRTFRLLPLRDPASGRRAFGYLLEEDQIGVEAIDKVAQVTGFDTVPDHIACHHPERWQPGPNPCF